MIHRHSDATLMRRGADLRNGQVTRLFGQIIVSRRWEIDEMKAILDRID